MSIFQNGNKNSFERRLGKKLRRALRHAAPDCRDEVLRRCWEADWEDGVIPAFPGAKTKKYPWPNLVAIVASLLLVVQFGFYQNLDFQQRQVETIIDLDVNPSIELCINRDDRVVEARGVNADAQRILEGMDLHGTQTKVAINAILGVMLSEGYISNESNSILLSVEAKSEEASAQIQTELVENIDVMMQTYSVNASILSQSVARNEESTQLAENYEISAGRMALIQKIVEQNSAYTTDDLVNLTINELNLLITSQGEMLQDVILVGTVSEASYIGQEHALEIAFKQQNLTAEQIAALHADEAKLFTDIEIYNARMVYRVIYAVDGTAYDYMIDSLSGDIVSYRYGEPEEIFPRASVELQEQPPVQEIPSVSENTISENTVSENTVSENSVSGNTVPDNTVSGNTVSGNSVSGNSVSGNSISENRATSNTVSGNTVSQNAANKPSVSVNTAGSANKTSVSVNTAGSANKTSVSVNAAASANKASVSVSAADIEIK